MATEYDLYLESRDRAGVTGVLESLPGFSSDPSGRGYSGPGVSSVVHHADEDRVEIIQEGYAFTPSLAVHFRVDLSAYNEAEGHIGNKTTISAALQIIEAVPGDAVLLFNGEAPLLLRVGGKLKVNNDGKVWTKNLLELVQIPHETASLPWL